jgi:hypothetical protein
MPRLEDCLIRHLLYASVQAYHDDPHYLGTPRWTRRLPPIMGEGGRSGIDLALAGTFREGIVVAFRGTLPPLDLRPNLRDIMIPDPASRAIAADWFNDANMGLVELKDEPIAIPGTVHKGFALSLRALWSGVLNAVNGLRSGSDTPRLYFTGHSKGGALANLAARAARRAWPNATVKAATFGAPRAGDETFAKSYHDAGIDCRRYEVVGDVVPSILKDALAPGSNLPRPLSHVGLQLLRDPVRQGWRGLFSPPIPSPFAEHLPYRGFGYGDHVCMAGLCSHDWG